MDWLQTWLLDDNYKIKIGKGAQVVVDWLTNNLAGLFDAISTILGESIDGLLYVLLGSFLEGTGLEPYYPFFMIAVFCLIAWLVRRHIGVVIFTALGLLLIYNQQYWTEAMETLSLVLAATAVSMVIGVPLGILAARRAWFYAFIRPILDLMQTIPTFVYLIPALILFGLGAVSGLVATVIFAIPAPIRLTRLGIISTPPALIEAAQAFGAAPLQVLTKVELPYALPQIMAGVTQTIMLSLSMVVIASMVGAEGLGTLVQRALGQMNVPMGFDSGMCIVILAIILDRIFKFFDEGETA
ncbi:choline ABC transporter permease subunit [Rhizobium sp. BK376]|uniref:choline ABC transporter permease subunit n=1 Tax=Rhizobium sp. BK376 TaxID=2512149 RepID=UPI001053310D|nr:choline ABC transporter permease subunit [Rhizobium sp. BK376]TCR92082.1 glycine betaine/proline transport system permease protein [Rhizobium sp. BK376]